MNTIKTPSTTTATGMAHYVSLDSLRGICALAVVLYHLPSTGWLARQHFFENSWLFVDFFFVLSGFVIGASYADRLATGFSVKRFMMLRLGRVYPLHLAILLALLALELVKLVVGASEGGNAAFTENSLPSAFVTNITLTQIFGFHDRVMWNSPSWSIAAEVWTYLIAALGLSFLGVRFKWALVATAIAMPVYLGLVDGHGLDRTFDMGLERCLYGFSLGMLAHMLHRSGRLAIPKGVVATVLEVVAAAATILLICEAPIIPDRILLLFPLLFAAVVFVFAGDGGAVSKALAVRPARLLGALSYSIYMIHILIIGRFISVMGLVGRFTHLKTVDVAVTHAGTGKALIGAGALPDLLSVVCLGVIVAVSWFTYRYIEIPARDWSRRVAKRFDKPKTATPAARTGIA